MRQTTIGGRVYAVDDNEKALFTKTEIDEARKRYIKEMAKKLVSEGGA